MTNNDDFLKKAPNSPIKNAFFVLMIILFFAFVLWIFVPAFLKG